MSSNPNSLAPVILLYSNNSIDSGVPNFNHVWDVTTLPSDFDIFFPPLSKNISYFTWCGCGKFKTSSATQSLTLTESMISFPYASNLISNALHLAANSTFHANLPRSFLISASPSCPQPLIIFPPISASWHL